MQTSGWADKEKEVERLQDDLEQQLETLQTALEAVKGEKNSLQAQIVTVRSLPIYGRAVTMVTLKDSTAELRARGELTGEH